MCALMRAVAEAINFYANGHVGLSGEEDRGDIVHEVVGIHPGSQLGTAKQFYRSASSA